MLNKIAIKRNFFHALRTSLLFVAGFLTYELLKMLEDHRNKIYPNNELLHFVERKTIHFSLIFLADFLILIAIALMFGINL